MHAVLPSDMQRAETKEGGVGELHTHEIMRSWCATPLIVEEKLKLSHDTILGIPEGEHMAAPIIGH